MSKLFVFLLLLLSFAGCLAKKDVILRAPQVSINPDLAHRVAAHGYPKLSNQLQLCCRQNQTVEQLDQLHYWDIAVVEVELIPNLPEYLGPSGKIRTLNPNAVLLGVFSAGDVYKGYDQPIHVGFHQLFSPEWYLYDVAKKPLQMFKIDFEWTFAQNPMTEVNSRLPEYLNQTVMNSSLLDGILYDWATTSVSWMNHRKSPRNKSIDIDNDSKADSDRKVDQLWSEGFSKMLKNSRGYYPPGTLILGNGGWNNGWDYSPYLNGIMIEQFLEGRKWNYKRFGWGSVMKTYAYYQNHSIQPRLSIVMANDDKEFNFNVMRFGLASTLMFDGYFSYSNRNGAYRVSRWFDEYSVDLKTGRAERSLQTKGYLGKPLGSAFNPNKPSEMLEAALMKNSNNAEKKVWRRDFEHGIVLVNPGKNAQEIDLKGQFRKIAGTVDSKFNDGSSLTSIRLESSQATILLKMNDN